MKYSLTIEADETEREEIQTLFDAHKWRFVVSNLDQWLREQVKYGEKVELQPARDKLYELVRDEELDLL